MENKHQMLVNKVIEAVSKANSIFPTLNLPMPTIRYSLRGIGTRARARYSNNTIEINPFYVDKDFDSMLNRTMVHEVSHLIVRRIYPHAKQAHGPEFRNVMRRLGVSDTSAKAAMSNDVAETLVKRGVMVPFYCGCAPSPSQVFKRSYYFKIMNGTKFSCKVCKQSIRV